MGNVLCCECCPTFLSQSTSGDFEKLSDCDPMEDKESEQSIDHNKQEDKIELVFRSKRTNVFSHGFNVTEDFELKLVKKTNKQMLIIKKAISQNFIFESMKEEEIKSVVDAMNIIEVKSNQDVIVQGEEGDFFYIVERGSFTVLVNDAAVAIIGDGKSFGELALLNNTPRQATIRADVDSTLFALDRDTFRYTLARSSADRQTAITNALSKVPLLEHLFDHQLAKICDTVEIVSYNPGDFIIRKGSEGNVFYMIKEGTVLIKDIGVKAQFADHTAGPGGYFGERALLTGEPRAANVVAETKVVVMALDRSSFNSLLGPLREVIDHNMNMQMINTIKLFAQLNEDERNRVVRSFVLQTFPAGTTIINEGDRGSEFYIMKSGNAKVLVVGKQVGELSAGTYFGEMALLDDDVRKATVVAVSVCECFVLDRGTFNRILGSLKDIMHRDVESRKKQMEVTRSVSGGTGAGIKFTDLNTVRTLGTGKFSRVTLVQHKHTKQVFSLKAMMKVELMAQKQLWNVMNEKSVLEDFDHPMIVKLYATFSDPKKLYMLQEFIQGGELFSIIHTADSDGIAEHKAKFYAGGILLCLMYLHSKGIAYRDMKPENCLIDKDGYPKLVDFGFAKVIKGKSFTLCGTPEYLAPEIVLGRGYNKAVDYWAFGVMVYELIHGQSPFTDLTGNDDQGVICHNIIDGRVAFPPDFDADCKDMVQGLLHEVQTRLGNLRGGCDDIKHHKWFRGFDFDGMMGRKLRAPWVPKIRNNTDTSHFDAYEESIQSPEALPNVDHGEWEKQFNLEKWTFSVIQTTTAAAAGPTSRGNSKHQTDYLPLKQQTH